MKTLKTILVMLFWCFVAVGYALVGATYQKGGTDSAGGYAKANKPSRGGRFA